MLEEPVVSSSAANAALLQWFEEAAATGRIDNDAALTLLAQHPSAASGRMLRAAVLYDASEAVVRQLLEMCPSAAFDSFCPIQYKQAHYLALSAPDSDNAILVLRMLVAADPTALESFLDGCGGCYCTAGQLPLHLCCADLRPETSSWEDENSSGSFAHRRNPVRLALAMLAMHPDSASTTEDRRRLPLHYASGSRASALPPPPHPHAPVDLIAALLAAHPPGASSRDENGRLPLHCAAHACGPAAVIAALHAAWPAAIECYDREGLLPLHAAAFHVTGPAAIESVAALLALWPEAAGVRARNARNSYRFPRAAMLPIGFAARRWAGNASRWDTPCRDPAVRAVLALLLRAHPGFDAAHALCEGCGGHRDDADVAADAAAAAAEDAADAAALAEKATADLAMACTLLRDAAFERRVPAVSAWCRARRCSAAP